MKIKTRFLILMTALSLLVFALVVVVAYVSTVNYTRENLKDRSDSVAGTAELAARQIDGDKIDYWLENGTDEEYNRTVKLLRNILDTTPYVRYVTVCRFNDDDITNIIEDYDNSAYEEDYISEPLDFGESFPYDGMDLMFKDELQSGKRIYIYDSTNKLLVPTHYEPIFDSDNNVAGYVCLVVASEEITSISKLISNKIIIIAALFVLLCMFVIFMLIVTFRKALEKTARHSVQLNKDRLFDQTARSLANAIDAKDKYTAGHSTRVAEYSRKIAELAGKTPEECDEVYYAALLHDVGKIGVPELIITKEGKLTDAEYKKMKEHSALGSQILHSITEYPNLAIGAHYHHERYDGTGYPDKLRGTEIPEIARIIAVADAYDAMTSNRSYRKSIPQETVREQFIQCSGTQFDPQFANIMLRLIDIDTKYMMKERSADGEAKIKDELLVKEHRSNVSKGILITERPTQITFKFRPDKAGNTPKPSFVLFDSLDGHYHWEGKKINERKYREYCEIDIEGNVERSDIRDYKIKQLRADDSSLEKNQYKIQAVRFKDHAQIVISERGNCYEITLALPDNTSFLYIGFTGEHCCIYDMSMSRSEKKIGRDSIIRIAPPISFIDGPEGDIPSVQVDGYRTDFSRPVTVVDGMEISFHTKCLPTARLIWHCPYCVIYSSDDCEVNGENYKEYALMRLDGETWNSRDDSVNFQKVDKSEFIGWDEWKLKNMEGFNCTIRFERKGNKIVAYSNNFGINIKNYTEVKGNPEEIFVALTGDQVVLTDIRIK